MFDSRSSLLRASIPRPAEHEKHGEEWEGALFPTDEGKFFTVEGFGKLFSRIATKSGVRRFHAHLLRHTWATNWMKQPGADLLSLQRQGGWKRLEMVERYSHAIPIKDRSVLPNPMAASTVIAYRREAVS